MRARSAYAKSFARSWSRPADSTQPRAAVRAALQRVGFDPVRLLGELAGPSPAWAIVRAAWVAERPIVVRLGQDRWTYAPEGSPGVAEGLERELVAMVRRSGRYRCTLFDDEAWPVAIPPVEGVVIAGARR